MRAAKFRMATAAVVVAALGVAAQVLAGQTSQRPAVQPAQMTLSGCLKSGPNPSGVPEAVTYTLEPVEAPSVPVAATESARPKTGTRYTLTAPASIDLSAHVGHRVEISGHLKDLSAAGVPATRDPQEKLPQPGGAHNTFEVSPLKRVAAKCP